MHLILSAHPSRIVLPFAFSVVGSVFSWRNLIKPGATYGPAEVQSRLFLVFHNDSLNLFMFAGKCRWIESSFWCLDLSCLCWTCACFDVCAFHWFRHRISSQSICISDITVSSSSDLMLVVQRNQQLESCSQAITV